MFWLKIQFTVDTNSSGSNWDLSSNNKSTLDLSKVSWFPEWFIELKSGEDVMTMKMSIRTNKPGHAGVKKLGQFSLAVKYNGLKKKW